MSLFGHSALIPFTANGSPWMEALSIRGSSMEQTCYQILAVPPGASSAEIRRAFRRQARRCHPDTAPLETADEARFQELLAAYRLLSSPLKRANYDAQLSCARVATSGSLLRGLRKLCRSRWCWFKASVRLGARASTVRPTSVRYRPSPVKVWVRDQPSGPTFGQVLAARQQTESSGYVLCEDGIIRQKNAVGERKRVWPSRPRRSSLTVVLRSWWGVLLVLMVGCWEVFRR